MDAKSGLSYIPKVYDKPKDKAKERPLLAPSRQRVEVKTAPIAIPSIAHYASMPVAFEVALTAGTMPLAERGTVELSEDCRLAYEVAGEPPLLVVTVASGLDRGRLLVVAAPDQVIDLRRLDLPCDLVFTAGRPLLGRPGGTLLLGDTPIATGRAQLVVGDTVTLDGLVIEVAG